MTLFLIILVGVLSGKILNDNLVYIEAMPYSIMENYQLEMVESPRFWMTDYWNMWYPRSARIHKSRKTGDMEWLRNNPAITFPEFISNSDCYDDCKCDLSTISSRFLCQSDRLVVVYNKLITYPQLDLDKLDKTVQLAHRVIYN